MFIEVLHQPVMLLGICQKAGYAFKSTLGPDR